MEHIISSQPKRCNELKVNFFFENKSTDLLFIYVFMCSIKYSFLKIFQKLFN